MMNEHDVRRAREEEKAGAALASAAVYVSLSRRAGSHHAGDLGAILTGEHQA